MLEANQTNTLSNSIFTKFSKDSRLESCAQRNVSSANNLTYSLVASGRSLIKIKNSKDLI